MADAHPARGLRRARLPRHVALAHGDRAFSPDGKLADAATADRLRQQVLGFYRLAEAVAPLCCGEARSDADQKKQQEIVRALEDESRIQPK